MFFLSRNFDDLIAALGTDLSANSVEVVDDSLSASDQLKKNENDDGSSAGVDDDKQPSQKIDSDSTTVADQPTASQSDGDAKQIRKKRSRKQQKDETSVPIVNSDQNGRSGRSLTLKQPTVLLDRLPSERKQNIKKK